MSNPILETVPNLPFSAFRFRIEINVAGISNEVCSAAFAECDGLEMSMDVKTIREGGNNGEQIRLTGPITYGLLTLKRGMTPNFDLWDWFNALYQADGAKLRSSTARVVLLAADGTTEQVSFLLKRCVPVKLKAPVLHARDGIVAIEELQLAYESLTLKRSGTSSSGGA